ncbi:DUF5133 domain-containing protein [Streptomyces sp. NPDC002793]|uniref:DUF5133 domain-containing protein n=1 Tax=Streptomyces sp. NPDC002793 TaxID=3154432 RepID=UPI0033186D64
MLMAHPAVLRNLIEQYGTLRILQAQNGDTEVQQRMDDIACAHCVATGTRDEGVDALAALIQLFCTLNMLQRRLDPGS